MAPLEPQQKVLVSKDFLSRDDHGEIECQTCHGGDPAAEKKDHAHKGLIARPSLTDPQGACGECHDEIPPTAARSLHVTLAPFTTILKKRADAEKHPGTWKQIDPARERHCGECHASCGGCHVSRPDSVGSGFVNGHMFGKRPDFLNQCLACHGSRVGNEYIGIRGQGDVHALRGNMHCVSCHGAGELHAAAPEGIKDRYHLKQLPHCTDCHRDLKYDSIRDHNIHIGKVQCQVCHSQTYTNCYSCHTGVDKEGLPFYVNHQDLETMKIGLNYEAKAPGADYDFMLVRHVPVDPDLFKHYVKDALPNFDSLPTWKRTSPHNILRKTWQTANCNHCHGNRALYLSKSDLKDYEIAANRRVVVPDNRVPAPIARVRRIDIDTSRVKTGWVIDHQWLKAHLGAKGLVIVDVRANKAYQAGHIPGAVSLNPLEDLRWPWGTDKPQELLAPEKIAAVFGQKGISEKDHIVVYDSDAWEAAFTLSVLDYMGAQNISFLKGGIQTWRSSGFPLSKEVPGVQARTFDAHPQRDFIVDSTWVAQNLDALGVVIVDIRTLDQSKKLAKHPRALRTGRIPGAVQFPIYGLYMDHAQLKPPAELLYALRNRGITPDKTVVLTCNTGAWAGAGFFMLRYLGFPDVRVYDASWVGWERFVRYPGCNY